MPEDKTTVTKDAVTSESAKEKEIENRVRENLKAEMSRESQALKEKLDEVAETIQKYEEQDRLTKAEQDKLDKARQNKVDAEKDMRTLKTDPAYAGLRGVLADERNGTVEAARHETSLMFAENLIRETARTEKVNYEDLNKEVRKIINPSGEKGRNRWATEMPYDRVVNALNERSAKKADSAKDEEIKSLKAKLEQGGLESGTGYTRDPGMDAKLNNLASGSIEDAISARKALGV